MPKRKSLAYREPNGRIQREPNGKAQRDQYRLTATSEVKRLRDAALLGMRDPLWGTEIGRLYLTGKITATAFAAGKRWAEQAVQYSQALCSPAPDPRAVSFDRSGGDVLDPDSYDGRREARRHERAVASFIDAHVALKSIGGASERAVRHVCERDQMLVGHESLMALIRGLGALAGFWGLTEHGKSTSDRHHREITAAPR
jgi:hypothetical protein